MSRFFLALLRILRLLPAWLWLLLMYGGRWFLATLLLGLRLSAAPVRLLSSAGQPVVPRLSAVAEAQLPDSAWIFFSDAAEALVSAGFIRHGDFRSQELIQQRTLWLRLLAQHEQGIVAALFYVEGTESALTAELFAEFSSAFSDGRWLVTHNRRRLHPLPAALSVTRIGLNTVRDPHVLYILHRDLLASLPDPLQEVPLASAVQNPATLLLTRYAQEMQALAAQGWLRLSADQRMARWRWPALLATIYRQAWLWCSVPARREQRATHSFLAAHGLDIAAYSGATAPVVERYPLHITPGALISVVTVYERARLVARHFDPNATLEGVLVDLEGSAPSATKPRRFYYTFRSSDLHYQRRIHRLRRFDIHLDPKAGILAVTAMQRAALRATDQAEWPAVANPPLPLPLRLGPWLADLEQVLPAAWESLSAQAAPHSLRLDAALLCNDPIPCWRVIAYNTDLHTTSSVIVNAYTGIIRASEHEPSTG